MARKKTPESSFRSACIDYLYTAYHGKIWHLRYVSGLHDASRKIVNEKGFMVPRKIIDDHFVIRGVPLQIEFKREDGKYSRTTDQYKGQALEIKSVIAAGGRAGFVDNWDALFKLLEGIEPVQKCLFQGRGA
jgi:hypothetical protein